MALDLDAIRRKLNNLQTQTGRQDNLWKPEPGKNQLRIVPYQFNKDNPFIELYFHYELGRKNYLSPVTFGEADPVVEFAEKLKATGNQDDWKMARKLEPKMRCYVPVLLRGRESEGVKFWGFGKTVYQELLGVIADPDYGDITDSTNGRDIMIERQTPAEAGNQYGKTTVRVKPNITALSDDSNVLEGLLNNQSNLTELYTEPTYDELKEALKNFLNPNEESTQETTTSNNVAASTTPTSNTGNTTTDTKKTENVEDAFDQLFNN